MGILTDSFCGAAMHLPSPRRCKQQLDMILTKSFTQRSGRPSHDRESRSSPVVSVVINKLKRNVKADPQKQVKGSATKKTSSCRNNLQKMRGGKLLSMQQQVDDAGSATMASFSATSSVSSKSSLTCLSAEFDIDTPPRIGSSPPIISEAIMDSKVEEIKLHQGCQSTRPIEPEVVATPTDTTSKQQGVQKNTRKKRGDRLKLAISRVILGRSFGSRGEDEQKSNECSTAASTNEGKTAQFILSDLDDFQEERSHLTGDGRSQFGSTFLGTEASTDTGSLLSSPRQKTSHNNAVVTPKHENEEQPQQSTDSILSSQSMEHSRITPIPIEASTLQEEQTSGDRSVLARSSRDKRNDPKSSPRQVFDLLTPTHTSALQPVAITPSQSQPSVQLVYSSDGSVSFGIAGDQADELEQPSSKSIGPEVSHSVESKRPDQPQVTLGKEGGQQTSPNVIEQDSFEEAEGAEDFFASNVDDWTPFETSPFYKAFSSSPKNVEVEPVFPSSTKISSSASLPCPETGDSSKKAKIRKVFQKIAKKQQANSSKSYDGYLQKQTNPKVTIHPLMKRPREGRATTIRQLHPASSPLKAARYGSNVVVL